MELAARLADDFALRAAEHDRDGTFPFENYDLMRDCGYLRLTVPEEFGGMGASLYELMLAQERLAMGDAATALAVNMHLTPIGQWAGIWRITRNPAIEDVLRRAGENTLVWAGFTSEPGVENVIMGAKTRATRAPGGYIVDGYKVFCTNIEVATDFTVSVQHDDPVHGPELLLLKVSRDSPGLRPVRNWDVAGMRSTQSGDLEIKSLFVPEHNVVHRQPIGQYNETIARTILCWGVSSFGAVYSGIGAGAIEWARQQVARRNRQTDPAVRQLFAEMEVLLETGRAVAYRHAQEVREEQIFEQLTIQEVMARSALAKMVPVNNTIAIMQKIIDAVGSAAFQRKQPFERMLRDAHAGPFMPFSNLAAYRLFAANVFGEELAPTGPALDLDEARAAAARAVGSSR
ncbi:MAG: acyl-CoA/acyl-ACP dehydrogenase [Steroidobacter sp.]|nr:acyl-CoA dehydrogenase family protein [Steroidobacter sp.]MBL8268337.1 acyl-CoA/acyl-ACP dehydrogenase [Steroidobacter sp.]